MSAVKGCRNAQGLIRQALSSAPLWVKRDPRTRDVTARWLARLGLSVPRIRSCLMRDQRSPHSHAAHPSHEWQVERKSFHAIVQVTRTFALVAMNRRRRVGTARPRYSDPTDSHAFTTKPHDQRAGQGSMARTRVAWSAGPTPAHRSLRGEPTSVSPTLRVEPAAFAALRSDQP